MKSIDLDRGVMRDLDIYCYVCLLTGLLFFYELDMHMLGIFYQVVALGIFIKSAYDQIKR